MFALKAIQNKVVEQGDDLGRYFMVHFNEVSNIPDILRSTSIDVAGNLQSSLSVIVRRIYGVESFRFDLGSPCKNEVEFSSQAMNEMDAVSQCRDGFMSLKHTKCLYDTCRKVSANILCKICVYSPVSWNFESPVLLSTERAETA